VASRADLLEVLARARERGFLGPGDPADHLDHALGYADVVDSVMAHPPARAADLGTGGGVPGLVLAVAWPETSVVLVESSVKRAEWLVAASAKLDLQDRVEVCCRRAEDLAHDPDRREHFEVVTARSFAESAVTAEVASGFASVGGLLVVSEPPEPANRWQAESLTELGFGPAEIHGTRGAHYACLRKVSAVSAGFPRRRGRAAKRPLWHSRST
jgi:16S rRNA (guanine527-N7)-methyltransferase